MPARGREGQGARLGGQKKRGDGSSPRWGQPELGFPLAQALGHSGHCRSFAAAHTELPPIAWAAIAGHPWSQDEEKHLHSCSASRRGGCEEPLCPAVCWEPWEKTTAL